MLTDKAQRQLDDLFTARHEALDIFKLVVSEWRTDPTSVQCFDLRIVEKAKYLDGLMKKLDILY